MEQQQFVEDLRDMVCGHDERLRILEQQNARNEEKFSSIESIQKELKKGMDKVESVVLNSNNSILSLLNQILTNNNQVKMNKDTNRSATLIQIIVSLGAVIVAFIGGYLY